MQRPFVALYIESATHILCTRSRIYATNCTNDIAWPPRKVVCVGDGSLFRMYFAAVPTPDSAYIMSASSRDGLTSHRR